MNENTLDGFDLVDGEELYSLFGERYGDLENLVDRAEEEMIDAGALPTQVRIGRRWRAKEVADLLAEWACDMLPEIAYEDQDLTHDEDGEMSADWPDLSPAEREAVAAAILPWAERCRPTVIRVLGTITVDRQWWIDRGLEV